MGNVRAFFYPVEIKQDTALVFFVLQNLLLAYCLLYKYNELIFSFFDYQGEGFYTQNSAEEVTVTRDFLMPSIENFKG